MSTVKVSSEASAASSGGGLSAWADLVPKSVDLADTMPFRQVQESWNKLYIAAGISTKGENVKRGFRAAVYLYGMLNGTSREGSYSGEMNLYDGTTVSAAIIPTQVGKMQVRKFFRGNMAESYVVLKTSGAVAGYPRFLAKVAEHSISAEDAFATADWLADCPDFTPSESKAHATMFQYSVSRARRAREGQSLEDVEAARVNRSLQSQGPMEPVGEVVHF